MKQKILAVLKEVVKELAGQETEPQLEHPAVGAHGDYATNIALAIFGGISNQFQNPEKLAERIKEKLEENKELSELVSKIEVVKPGFINFWISKDALVREMWEVGDAYGSSDTFKNQTVVIDYSGPNIAKPFGIGHLRSTIIGQAIYNFYKFLGACVIGDNHLGDWGRQFGVLLYQITSKGMKSTGVVDVDQITVDKLEELYVEFHKEVEENETLWDEARAWFKKLEEGDEQAREIWQKVKDISLLEFEKVYKMLGVEIDYAYGESFYQEIMSEVIDECREKGIAKESEGALIVEFPSAGGHALTAGQGLPPAILRKSDETTNYFTRDLATVKFRLKEWAPSLILYEVGVEQALHFQQLFATVKLLGWADPSTSSGRVAATRFVHIKHGLYLGPNGKKFSTRKGETVRLEDVLQEAIERAVALASTGPAAPSSRPTSSAMSPAVARRDALRSRHPSTGNRKLSTGDSTSVAVGVGAVKYFDLSHHPSSNIIFDWEKIMALEGNSAPYLQYTHARTRSVLEKSLKISDLKIDWKMMRKTSVRTVIKNCKFNDEELSILRSFYRFPEVVEEAAVNFSPNLLCNFLFDLAQKYNAFYSKHRILESKTGVKEFRLGLTGAVGNILKTGLNLLGISAPERM